MGLEYPEQAHGPLYLVLPASTSSEDGTERPGVCLAVNTTLGSKVFPHVLGPEASQEEPDEIQHVVRLDLFLKCRSFAQEKVRHSGCAQLFQAQTMPASIYELATAIFSQ